MIAPPPYDEGRLGTDAAPITHRIEVGGNGLGRALSKLRNVAQDNRPALARHASFIPRSEQRRLKARRARKKR